MNRIKLHMNKRIPSLAGFSLIELMVAIAIVGILVAIAFPSYSAHIVKKNRSLAQTHLMDIVQREQQYLLDKRSYASTLSDLTISTPTTVSSLYDINIAVAGGPPPSFTVTATPITGTTQSSDGVLSINSSGTKLPANKW